MVNFWFILIFGLTAGLVATMMAPKFLRAFFSKQPTAAKSFGKNVYPCVVIGGGAGGLTGAIYLAQLGCKTLVLQGENPGGALTKTHSVQNWPGEIDIPGQVLINKLNQHAKSCGAVLLDKNVAAVNFKTWPFEITLAGSSKTPAKKIAALSCIVATGSTANRLSVPGEEEFWGHGVTNCAICDAPLYKNKTVAVVGGGDSAATEVEILSPLAKKVYWLVRGKQLRAKGNRVAKIKNDPKVEILYETEVQKILGNAQGLENILIKTAKNGESTLPIDGLFLAIGSMPNTKIFENQLSLNNEKFIKLREGQATSVNGVFAIGDVSDEKYRQAITAAGSGCIAALQALEFLIQKNVNLADFSNNVLPTSSAQTSQPDSAGSTAASQEEEPPTIDEEEKPQPSAEKYEPEELETEESEELEDVTQAISTVEELNQILATTQLPAVIDFNAAWCLPCKRMQPIFEELALQFKKKINFLTANVDVAEGLLKPFGIQGVPTFVFLDVSGKLVTKAVGQLDREDFIELLNKLL